MNVLVYWNSSVCTLYSSVYVLTTVGLSKFWYSRCRYRSPKQEAARSCHTQRLEKSLFETRLLLGCLLVLVPMHRSQYSKPGGLYIKYLLTVPFVFGYPYEADKIRRPSLSRIIVRATYPIRVQQYMSDVYGDCVV